MLLQQKILVEVHPIDAASHRPSQFYRWKRVFEGVVVDEQTVVVVVVGCGVGEVAIQALFLVLFARDKLKVGQ